MADDAETIRQLREELRQAKEEAELLREWADMKEEAQEEEHYANEKYDYRGGRDSWADVTIYGSDFSRAQRSHWCGCHPPDREPSRRR